MDEEREDDDDDDDRCLLSIYHRHSSFEFEAMIVQCDKQRNEKSVRYAPIEKHFRIDVISPSEQSMMKTSYWR